MSELSFLKHDKYQHAYIQVPLADKYLVFFSKNYMKDGKESIDGSNHGPFPGLVDMICEKKPYRKYRLKKRVPGKKLTIMIPKELKHSKVSEVSLLALQKSLENIFYQMFVAFIDGALACGSSESGAVKSFLDNYEIQVDDWEENAARMFYRRAKGYEK
jgi:hypothetical protein